MDRLRRGNRTTNCTKFKTEIERDNQLIYDYGVKYYYWDYYEDNESIFDDKICNRTDDDPAPNENYKLKDWFITPHFENLKDEMLNNHIKAIGHCEWKGVVLIAMKLLKTSYVTKIKCEGENREKLFGIKSGDPITMNHIISMMIYCGFDVCSLCSVICCYKMYINILWKVLKIG